MQIKTILLVPAIVAVAACQQPAAVSVKYPWVRLAAVQGSPAAAYFTLKGGSKDETLTSVSAPAATRAEMHESMAQGGMQTMAPIKFVAIRAGDTVTFQPRGKHVMLFGLKPDVRPGSATPLILTFASGWKITVEARVLSAAAWGNGD